MLRNWLILKVLIGSPPRLWGIFMIIDMNAGRERFTPTPVGNIGYVPERGQFASVHPHACGEYVPGRRHAPM